MCELKISNHDFFPVFSGKMGYVVDDDFSEDNAETLVINVDVSFNSVK